MKGSLIGLGFILFFAFGIFQLIIGYQGIEYHLGSGWAIAALVGTFVFRFTLPITIGTYFGVVDVLEWHWFIALLVTLPGLLFLIPSVLVSITESMRMGSPRKVQNTSFKSDDVIDMQPVEDEIKNDISDGQEVSATIRALKNLESAYHSDDIFRSAAVTDVFKKAKTIIKTDKADIVAGINEGRDPVEIALTALWNVSNEEVSLGNHHTYRGVLSDRGRGYLYVFNKTVDILFDEGFIDQHEADDNRESIRTNIKAAG